MNMHIKENERKMAKKQRFFRRLLIVDIDKMKMLKVTEELHQLDLKLNNYSFIFLEEEKTVIM